MTANDKLTTVSALALPPDGSQLAVYGEDSYRIAENWKGFIFVLDPHSGVKVSAGMLEIEQTTHQFNVNSRAFLINNAGIVYWAENALGTSSIPLGYEQKFTIGAYDSTTNSLVYHK